MIEEETQMVDTTSRRETLRLIGASAIGSVLPLAAIRPSFAADKRLAMVVKNLGNSYFDACAEGAKEAAKELGGIEIIYTAPTKATAEDQIAVIDGLIAQKVDGIMVSANDADALVPVGKKAAQRGIKVISFDSAIAQAGRIMHLNASSTDLIGAKQVQMISKTLKGEGEVAILSAASTMTNQNSWIAAMKEEWKKPEYAKLQLVGIVYGDDQDDKSYREMQGLVKSHPNLRGVISPTTIGIRAGAKAIIDGGLVGKVYITGLGLPSEMKDAVLKGACESFAIWNPVDYGYASTQILAGIIAGEKADPGSTVKMGRMGSTKIDAKGEAAMGEPFTFDKSNVEKFAKIF
jgi:rhamnose transport system substrate-binding protein